MKKMSEILTNIEMGNQEENSFDKKTMELVDLLFNDLLAAFPAFQQAWPNQEIFNTAKRIWTAVFIKENFKDAEAIKRGILEMASQTNPFVPTAGQFMEMCKIKSIPRAHQDYMRLENTPTPREEAIQHLNKLKKLLS